MGNCSEEEGGAHLLFLLNGVRLLQSTGEEDVGMVVKGELVGDHSGQQLKKDKQGTFTKVPSSNSGVVAKRMARAGQCMSDRRIDSS